MHCVNYSRVTYQYYTQLLIIESQSHLEFALLQFETQPFTPGQKHFALALCRIRVPLTDEAHS
jgi:hypothetical protein